MPCSRGSSKTVAGTHKCSKCSEDSFAEEEGSLECNICDMGSIMVPNKAGILHCKTCLPGTYQNAKGQHVCIDCPADTFSETTGNTALAQCLKCVEFAPFTTTNGTTGIFNATLGCVCQGGFYHNPVKEAPRSDYCLPCPKRAECALSKTTIQTMVTRRGFWRESNYQAKFYPCFIPEDCIGGEIKNNIDDQCSEGNTGTLCAICQANYVRVGGKCTICTGGGAGQSGLSWFFGIGCLLYILFTLWRLLKVDGEEVLTTVVEELVAEEDAEEQVVANSQEETENNIELTLCANF